MKAVILFSNEGMYTKGMVLDNITEKQFDLYKPLWNAEKWNNRDAILCEITKTIVDTNYEHLLLFLLNHEYADELCVRINARDWDKEYKSRITYHRRIDNGRVEGMAKEAAANRTGDNYLEIKLKEPGIKENIPRAIIEFSERNGLIIATKVVIPPRLTHLFTIDSAGDHSPWKYYHGILGNVDYEHLAAQKMDLMHS